MWGRWSPTGNHRLVPTKGLLTPRAPRFGGGRATGTRPPAPPSTGRRPYPKSEGEGLPAPTSTAPGSGRPPRLRHLCGSTAPARRDSLLRGLAAGQGAPRAAGRSGSVLRRPGPGPGPVRRSVPTLAAGRRTVGVHPSVRGAQGPEGRGESMGRRELRARGRTKTNAGDTPLEREKDEKRYKGQRLKGEVERVQRAGSDTALREVGDGPGWGRVKKSQRKRGRWRPGSSQTRSEGDREAETSLSAQLSSPPARYTYQMSRFAQRTRGTWVSPASPSGSTTPL